MNTLKLQILIFSVLSIALMFAASAYPQLAEDTQTVPAASSGMAVIEIRNVRYLLPKGTRFRKRAGVITFEGAGEYTARRLYDLEERLRESEQRLKRIELELRGRRTLLP